MRRVWAALDGDSPADAAWYDPAKDAWTRIADLPVAAVILTHNHADHVMGGRVFTDAGTDVPVWSHARLPAGTGERGQLSLRGDQQDSGDDQRRNHQSLQIHERVLLVVVGDTADRKGSSGPRTVAGQRYTGRIVRMTCRMVRSGSRPGNRY